VGARQVADSKVAGVHPTLVGEERVVGLGANDVAVNVEDNYLLVVHHRSSPREDCRQD
jgi:hypothetical protein